jgi:hypothetical protein
MECDSQVLKLAGIILNNEQNIIFRICIRE